MRLMQWLAEYAQGGEVRPHGKPIVALLDPVERPGNLASLAEDLRWVQLEARREKLSAVKRRWWLGR